MKLSKRDAWAPGPAGPDFASARGLSRVLAPFIPILTVIALGCSQADFKEEVEGAYLTIPAPDPENEGWSLVFADEFNGDSLDMSKWTTCYWWDDNGCTNLGNNELEWYRPENAAATAGALRLSARRQRAIGINDRVFDYTSGMVTTGRLYGEPSGAERFQFRFGYAEIRARSPQGAGFWPAFWLLPTTLDSLPEIDVMEVDGRKINSVSVHFHYDGSYGRRESAGKTCEMRDDAAGWHTFAVDWRPGALTWYVDGAACWRFDDGAHVANEPMYLLLNLAVGGDHVGPPSEDTQFPSEFIIDYVRVWRR